MYANVWKIIFGLRLIQAQRQNNQVDSDNFYVIHINKKLFVSAENRIMIWKSNWKVKMIGQSIQQIFK